MYHPQLAHPTISRDKSRPLNPLLRIIRKPNRGGFCSSPNHKLIFRARIIPNTPQRVKLIRRASSKIRLVHDMLEVSFPHNVTTRGCTQPIQGKFLDFWIMSINLVKHFVISSVRIGQRIMSHTFKMLYVTSFSEIFPNFFIEHSLFQVKILTTDDLDLWSSKMMRVIHF